MPLPNVSFGPPKKEELNWRDPKFVDTTPDDDEELPATPPDVKAMLGFDPKVLSK